MIRDSNPSEPQVNPSPRASSEEERAVVLFDGFCNFCNGSVDFIVRRDASKYFRFAASDSEAARPYLERFEVDREATKSMLLVEEGRLYIRSTASLRIARRLSGFWPALYVFILVPAPIRDFFYGIVSRNRNRWSERRETCRVPTEEERERFL